MPEPYLYKEVPSDWTYYYPIYDRAVATAPRGSILIEVGSFWGKGAIYLAELAKAADKDLKVYCVDLWGMRPDNNPPLFQHGEWLFGDPNAGNIEPKIHAQHNNSLFETFAHFVDRTRLSPDPLRIMRMDTFEAQTFFQGLVQNGYGHIHMVFLDNDHEYEHVKKELELWGKLVDYGGIIAGDDYTQEFHGVIEAVGEYFEIDNPYEDKVEIVNGRCWMVQL
jgi:cephalosporin hydroxylase